MAATAHLAPVPTVGLTAPTPEVRTEGTRTVVALPGEWDFSARPVLSDVLSRAIASGVGDVVIDLAEASFIDTATARVLAVGQVWLRRHDRTLILRSPSKPVARVLDLFGLTDLIVTAEPVAAGYFGSAA